MSKIFYLIASLLFSFSLSAQQEDHYDLLNSLDPAGAPQKVEYESRNPASVESNQIEVRKKLPDARLKKTARTLQWEMLQNGKEAPQEESVEE